MINDDRCEVDDYEYDKVTTMVTIEWGTGLVYECTGEVQLFRGIPASAEITAMKRIFLVENGKGIDESFDLALEDFPHFIMKAAEKKMVEDL